MTTGSNERSTLLPTTQHQNEPIPRRRTSLVLLLVGVTIFVLFCGNNRIVGKNELIFQVSPLQNERYPTLGARLKKAKLKNKKKNYNHDTIQPPPFVLEKRCWWVAQKFQEKDAGKSDESLKVQYQAQSLDSNVFFRATANLFWNDFVANDWGNWMLATLKLPKNSLDPKSTWTWVTGDQHLSNFGAWRNRHGDIVFGVNDFDEAAIYDFHVDVLRIAVSICNHAVTNGLSPKHIDRALQVFTDSYVDTIKGYVGNDHALLFELTPKTAYGVLRDFLIDVDKRKSSKKQLQKFTEVNETTGQRYFIKGGINVPDNVTNLADIPPDIEAQVGSTFSPTNYGATMIKMGWHVRQWDDDFFTVLDVAERVGSGIGSYGVDRYYVLLKGTDGLLVEDEDGSAVILDCKEQPLAAVERVLSANDKAWYDTVFPNGAARVVEAQRRLTSYVDPFTGWFLFHDEESNTQIPISVRQRSPWKDSIDLDKLTKQRDFEDFIAQIAAATATSHVRGTVAKAPATFKDIVHSIMKKDKKNKAKWGAAVAELAKLYHQQVLLDFECFQEFVNTTYGGQDST